MATISWSELSEKKEHKIEPYLLGHPNIPKPLHGTSPRTILGDAWWNKTRKNTYAERDYHCFACGVHKTKAWPKQWLEAHEDYAIDYDDGRVVLNRIVALCRACHSFIHSGLMAILIEQGKLDWELAEKIVNHGHDVASKGKIYPSHSTCYLINNGYIPKPENFISVHKACELGYQFGVDWDFAEKEIAPWGKWRLVIDGKEYYSQFKNQAEWTNCYEGERESP